MSENKRSADAGAYVDQWVKTHGATRDRLLPLLHALQEEFGFVSDGVVPLIAERLNISRADVHGVVTFYPDFRRHPGGRHKVQICRAESCQARGSDAIEALLAEGLKVRLGETRGDGAVSLEAVYCLGLCAIGPNALVDGEPVARIDEGGVARIVAQVSA